MKKINLISTAKLVNTYARMEYKGAVKVNKGARLANEYLTEKMAALDLTPAEKGKPFEYKSLVKSCSYTVALGVAIDYAKRVQSTLDRNGATEQHEITVRDLGMFPYHGAFIWVKNDLSTAYIRMLQVSKPTDTKYFADGSEISKYAVAQWLPSDDFKRLSGEWVAPAQAHNEDGDLIYAKDEDGKNILDVSGQPVTIALPPLRAVNIENCTIFLKGRKINFFTDVDESDEVLKVMRDEYRKRYGLPKYED